MKIICKIAKAELRMLFCSPIAWLLLVFFVIQSGLFFTDIYEAFLKAIGNEQDIYRASYRLFTSTNAGVPGLWAKVQEFVYLYIPLITMGIVSKDISSGSIKLLYSSPISNARIILGKFCALAVYAAVMAGLLLVYVVIAGCSISHFEWGCVLTGLLGLYLLLCAYMAVGIFLSSLTTYQIIAAVGTFVVLLLLNIVNGWGQEYDVVRDITWWLCLQGRATTFIDGMLCSEDLLYFPVVTGLFLSLAIIRLNGIRQKLRFTKVAGQYAAVVLLVSAAAYFSSRPALLWYYDTTTQKINTVTPNTQEILKQAKGGMTISSFVNVCDPNQAGRKFPGFIMDNREIFRQYTRFKPEIDLKVYYHYLMSPWESAKGMCKFLKMDTTILQSREEMEHLVDLSEEGYPSFIRQIVRENGQKEWLRFDGEAEIAAALKRSVMELPTIAFVNGHRERGISRDDMLDYSYVGNYKRNQYSAWNQGFEVMETTLQQPLPEKVNYLIIGDMRDTLTSGEEQVLQAYLDRGGSLLFMGDPAHREVQNKVLGKFFGLELTPMLAGTDIRNQGRLKPYELGCYPTPMATEKMYHIGVHPVIMSKTSGVEQIADKGFTVHPLLKCDETGKFWTELETTDFVDDTVLYNPAAGEIHRDFSTLVGLTRMVGEKEQRIIVSGDADCIANNVFQKTWTLRNAPANRELFLGMSYWLSHELAPIDVRRPKILPDQVALTKTGNTILRAGLLWVLPVWLMAMGVVVWLRRRGR